MRKISASQPHEKNCSEMEMGAYLRERRQLGMDDSRLSIVTMFDDSTVVVVGFLTSFIYVRVAGLAPENHQANLAILVIAFALLTFSLTRFFVNSIGVIMWRFNREWIRVMLRMAQFVRTVLLFLVTHFIGSLFDQWWQDRRLSWIEALAAIYIILLTLYFLVDLFHLN